MLRGRTRVLSACQRCRKQKIKCSGAPDCRTCRGRGLRCDWGSEEKQVLVPERELFELRNKVKQLEDQLMPSPGGIGASNNTGGSSKTWDNGYSAVELIRLNNLQLTEYSATSQNFAQPYDNRYQPRSEQNEGMIFSNPLAPSQPAYVQESTGKLRYLGHSSTYAFTQHVLHMLQQDSPSNPSPEVTLNQDTDRPTLEAAFRLTPSMEPDISGLPSRSSALYHLQSIKFRTQPLFYLFDEEDFTFRLHQFYKDAAPYARSDPVWYVHYLILMAFGRALDPHEQVIASTIYSKPEYLTRALCLMPDMTCLADNPVETTEIFCCVALYLQSIGHRDAAVTYIALALRMAHLYALHLGLQESIIGRRGVERGRRAWMTVYVLNQKLTSNSGIPNFIHNEDVSGFSEMLSEQDEDDNASSIHLKICHLLGHLINKVYFPSRLDRSSFVTTTQTLLRGAANIAGEVKQYSEKCFGDISRVAAHLELAYHHCIILACRPALFFLGKLRTKKCRNEHSTSPSTALTGLVQVCVDSALQTATAVNQLQKHNLLDAFLPFDLECSFSAALVLAMASHILPQVVPTSFSTQEIKEVINAIAIRGNMQAKTRYLEIERLEGLLQQQTQTLLQTRRQTQTIEPDVAEEDDAVQLEQLADYGDLFFNGLDFDNGLHAHHMMNLADALGPEDIGMFQ